MASFQRSLVLGNITRDIELRYTPNGTAVADLSIAVNRTWKGEDGQKHEETTFFDCVAWARTAEIASEYLRKGSSVFVEGRFQNQSWTDKQSGKKRSKLVLVVENLQLIGTQTATGKPSTAPRQQPPAATRQPARTREPDPDLDPEPADLPY
jgi:single-strand DNA-binding protein